MVLVDVFVPSIDKTYNFTLEEIAPIGQIVEELIELVERAEQTRFVGDRSQVVLINRETQHTLPRENTLQECSVATGSTLLLI